MSPMYYDVFNHPDENYLASIYPNDILKNMPAWIKKFLSSTESKKACERYVESILSDFTLLSQYMKNYEISQKGIDAYKDELDKAEAEVEPEDIDYDDVDFLSQRMKKRSEGNVKSCTSKWNRKKYRLQVG